MFFGISTIVKVLKKVPTANIEFFDGSFHLVDFQILHENKSIIDLLDFLKKKIPGNKIYNEIER